MKVTLLDEHRKPIDCFDSGICSAGSSEWQKVEHNFSSYPAGVRYIKFEDGSKDKQFWSGHYGAKMCQPTVKIHQSEISYLFPCNLYVYILVDYLFSSWFEVTILKIKIWTQIQAFFVLDEGNIPHYPRAHYPKVQYPGPQSSETKYPEAKKYEYEHSRTLCDQPGMAVFLGLMVVLIVICSHLYIYFLACNALLSGS